MKKKILTILLLPLSLIANERIEFTQEQLKQIENAHTLKQKNKFIDQFVTDDLPKSGEGVVIKPSSPDSKGLKNDDFNFDNNEAQDAINLINKDLRVKSKIISNTQRSEAEDTELKNKASEINLSFKYTQIKHDHNSYTYGFVPYGSLIENKGWSGISEYFEHDKVGRCNYIKDYYKLYDGAMYLEQNKTTYSVNNKPTVININGVTNKAFMYKISWFDNKFANHLECANLKFLKETRKEFIELAIKIDSKR